jgi:hypothetical protein
MKLILFLALLAFVGWAFWHVFPLLGMLYAIAVTALLLLCVPGYIADLNRRSRLKQLPPQR